MEGEPRRKHRMLRVCLTLGLTVAATAAIGYGGLAAWSATTVNQNNTLAAGTVHHSNKATSNVTVTGATGASTNSTCTDLTSPGSCNVIFAITNAKPGATATGTVVITNTGSLDSNFTFGQPIAPTSSGGSICADTTLQVQDAESPVGTVFATGSINAVIAPVALKTSNTSPVHTNSALWSTTDTDTFTFTVTLSGTASATDQGQTCTASFTFTQTNA